MDTSRRGRCQIKRLLIEAGISQAELARRTGISKRTISHLANDDRPMWYDDARSISQVLGCTMEDLYEY